MLSVRRLMVFYAGDRANFAVPVRTISRAFPKPLGRFRNSRSRVDFEGFADFLVIAALRPVASDAALLTNDGHHPSAPEVVTRIGNAFRTPARLVALPRIVWLLCAAVGGRLAAVAQRLTGSLQDDGASSHARLHWTPPLAVVEALARAVRDAR